MRMADKKEAEDSSDIGALSKTLHDVKLTEQSVPDDAVFHVGFPSLELPGLAVMFRPTLSVITLRYITLRYITLHYITLRHITISGGVPVPSCDD